MAQYYNFVTNASGTFTLEEVQRFSVNGQEIQLVVEDVNNDGNGSQQFVTYTTAPQNSEQAIFSPQNINLGNQIVTTRLEQRQNVFVIKTNNRATNEELLKSNTVHAHMINENTVNVTNNTDIKLECNSEKQQMQWMKMQDNNTTRVTKQNTQKLLQERNQTTILAKNQLQDNITSSSLHVNSESQPGQTERKLLRLYQNKPQAVLARTSNAANVKTSTENQIQNSSVLDPKSASFCGKIINPLGQNVTITPHRASDSNLLHARPVVVPLEMSKSPPDMKHLREQIKQTRLKQQSQKQLQNSQQRLQQNNVQRQMSRTLQHPTQPSSNNSTCRSVNSTSVQRKSQQSAQQGQKIQKSLVPESPSSPDAHNTRGTMDVDPSEYVQAKEPQVSPSRSECENNSSESIAYLQKTIHDPTNAIVQHQIQGNTAKMLVMLATGEQRLITFDIPNEDCTVHDLLDQVNITFSSDTIVSLVDDPALGINYIVDDRSGTFMTSCEVIDHSDCNSSTQESASSNLTSDNLSQNINASDENSDSSQPSNEEPILVKGMLALCPHCGYSSLHFNRCERCNTKLSKEVKSIPNIEEKMETGMPVYMFYKKTTERGVTKLEKIERDGLTYKRFRGKGRILSSKLKPKEPECLTISSDEEEEGKIRKTENVNSNTMLDNANNAVDENTDTILDKEPIITNNSVLNISSDFTNSEEISKGIEICDNQSFTDNGQSIHTALQCRTIRIGSYKYIPREKVVISQNGVRFGVPLLEDDNSFVTLNVKFQHIVKVLIHFGKTMPVLFFYTSISTGAMIRELLGMQDPKGPYYDPAGRDHTHKRITLLPEKLTDDSKIKLKSLFFPDKMAELNPKEANDILLRASPKDNSQIHSIIRRQNQNVTLTTVSATDAIQTITVYPPPPAKGGIAINTEDYLCLSEDQFLNDVIIDFYLKYLTLEILSENDQHRTHVFSSYFYKRLTSPHAQVGENTVPMTPAAKRHSRVQKWTKNVNIFEKDFIIIPINERAHWFLAIICFPGLVGKVPTIVTKTNEKDVNETVQKSKKLKEVKTKTVTIGSTTITPVTTTITIDQPDDGSERDEAEGDDEEMEMDSDEEDENEQPEESKPQPDQVEQDISQQEENIKTPCILIFDSLAGASRARVVATLRDYLNCEHVAKLGTEKLFSKDTIKGSSPKVPQQSNFTDCGLYVLQYVESFFKDPIKNYVLPIKTLKAWFEEIVVTRKREELSKLLIKLMNTNKGNKTINLPTANFPTQDGKLKPRTENQTDTKIVKSELENKRKVLDTETHNVSAVGENTESSEPVNKTTYQIIPYSPSTSSNSTESNSTEMLVESKTQRSSSETMSYLKSKRIPRLMLRTQNQDESQSAKKHKGESFNSCK